MLYRTLLVGTAIAIGCTTAVAQSDVLPSTALMRTQGQHFYRTLNRMVRGEDLYDQAKVDAAFAGLVETSAKISSSFPESSKGKISANSNYQASPKIWETKDDFDAKAALLTKGIEDNRGKAATLDDLKAVYPVVNGLCNACHDTYRVRIR